MLAVDVIQRAEKRIGQTLCGKWHLDRVIGVGGMAAVYEATHRNRNRVAIKLLHPELSLDEGTRARFLREGYVANTIRHPGAVQVLDDDITADNVAFLVMELLQGETLEERMMRKGGVLSYEEALLLMEQLLDLLAVAHDQGVIHRDIKPDNLFLTREGELKVLDFGIARLVQGDARSTKVGSFMGTPAFCAPEQARGRWDEVDARTDLFSVGATLFTMLSGAHVHEAETSSEQLALAISATARSLRVVCPSLPTELIELVDQSLAYDKEDRFQTARAMKAAVQRVTAGLSSSKKVSLPPLVFPSFSTRIDGLSESRAASLLSRVVIGVMVASLIAALLLFVIHRERAGENSVVAAPLEVPAVPEEGSPETVSATPPPGEPVELRPAAGEDEEEQALPSSSGEGAVRAPSDRTSSAPAKTSGARGPAKPEPVLVNSTPPASPASPSEAGLFDKRY